MNSRIVIRIFAMFDRFGRLSYGDDASQLQHALQTAELARRYRCSEALVAAGLLHDIGQFLDDAGNAAKILGADARHEQRGAAFLQRYFPAAVTEPVRLHVAAKRYLCAVDPTYLDGLSAASTISLALQGGPMGAGEAGAFQDVPFFADAVQLRRFDDKAKNPEWTVLRLESHRHRLEALSVQSAPDSGSSKPDSQAIS